MPAEENAGSFDVASLEQRANAFGRLSIENKLAQLRRSPIWAQPEGPGFFEHVASTDKEVMFGRMAIEDQAVLYERVRSEQVYTH